MNVNYAPAAFPSTTDAWMHARPTVSPLKTADDAYRYTTQGPVHNSVPSPPPSLTASTPRAQWLAGSDGGRRTSSYSSNYTSSGSYAPSPVVTGSPTDDHWSPTGPYSPSYLPPAPAPQHHHYQQAPPPPQSYPSAVPLGHQMPLPNTIPMPVPLGSAQPRRRGKLPKATTEYLKDWLHKHADHPYPTEDEKKRLCAVTGLSMSQVSNWMINARRRILAPARANATPATTTTTPYGVPPFAQGPPRPPSGDSSATSRSGDLLYSAPPPAQAYPQSQTLPPLPQPGHLGGVSPPHRTNSWPTLPPSHQPPSPPHMAGHYGYPTDGTISRGSPHSSHHSDHILPPVSTLPPVSISGEQ